VIARRFLEAPVLVATDSFKGTLSAERVASAVARGLRDGGRRAVEVPVADGGEGTMEVLLRALGGERRRATVSDPLGRPVRASFALVDGGETAVVEMAQASGLGLVAAGERDAWAASTRGTGELIVAAVEAGARRVVVAAGGSATTDGGSGAVEAIRDATRGVELVVACDVRTPWEDAARVFSPQKGAEAATVRRLERRLTALARSAPRDPRGVPMTGAAGGLAGGLWAHLGARLVAGAPYVLAALRFDDAMRASRFVVTGEGRIDEQSLRGKVVGEIATRCRQSGVACHAVVGQRAIDDFQVRLIDLSTITEAGTPRRLRTAGRRLAEI
jgi:glycerate kinase